MQPVVGHVVGSQINPDFGLAPVRQGAGLDQVVRRVLADDLQPVARRRLCCAQAGDPGSLACQRALQRFDLARVAAGFARLHRVVKAVAAVCAGVSFDRLMTREVDVQFAAVVLFRLVDQLVGF